MKSIKLILSVIIIATMFNGCVAIFYPKKEKVTFSTGNKDATVYLNNDEIGKGKMFTEKVAKDGMKQIVTRSPGYKDSYTVMMQTHRAPGFWVCILFDIPFIYGLAIDPILPKGLSYDKQINLKSEDKLVYRGDNDKHIDISNIRLDVKSKKNIKYFYLNYTGATLLKDIEIMEKKKDTKDADKKAKEEAKAKKKGKKKGKLDENEEDLTYDDTKFSYNVYKTLKTTGFVDTVNKVFADNNNTLILEGSIQKIHVYTIMNPKLRFGSYNKSKLFLRWYIKNSYNEILDSLDTKEYSGDFVIGTGDKDNAWEKMFADAVDISYLRLQKDGKLAKYIKNESNFNYTEAMLSLPSVKSAVTAKDEATIPSVIVKTKDGHGSGFAITQDGYILTNYHVIAGKMNNKPNSVKIITSSGEELPGTIVRYNKFRDLALIKVDKKFDKAFKMSNVKTFKPLQDVYTIGAPKSIELGQSYSVGVISSERKANNNNLLQLGMSVNGGNSGGPLFDASGALHGVIVSKLIGNNTEGVSFAIPGYLIQEYLNINYAN